MNQDENEDSWGQYNQVTKATFLLIFYYFLVMFFNYACFVYFLHPTPPTPSPVLLQHFYLYLDLDLDP